MCQLRLVRYQKYCEQESSKLNSTLAKDFARVVCFLEKFCKIQTSLAKFCKSLSMIIQEIILEN